jgi:rRNA maturation endonuclease Nob1
MERMLCEGCSAVTYSAAATMLIERGDRCPRCGGRLAIVDERMVTVAADTPPAGEPVDPPPTE